MKRLDEFLKKEGFETELMEDVILIGFETKKGVPLSFVCDIDEDEDPNFCIEQMLIFAEELEPEDYDYYVDFQIDTDEHTHEDMEVAIQELKNKLFSAVKKWRKQ